MNDDAAELVGCKKNWRTHKSDEKEQARATEWKEERYKEMQKE